MYRKFFSGMSAPGSTTHGLKKPVSSGEEINGLTQSSACF